MTAQTLIGMLEEMMDLKVQQFAESQMKLTPEVAPLLKEKRETDRRRLEQIKIWRQDKYTHGIVRQCCPQLLVPLPIDVEDDVDAVVERLLYWRTWRSVPMPPVNSGPLEQFAARRHPVELLLIAEAVVHPVDFSRSRRTGRHAHRPPQLRITRQQGRRN